MKERHLYSGFWYNNFKVPDIKNIDINSYGYLIWRKTSTVKTHEVRGGLNLKPPDWIAQTRLLNLSNNKLRIEKGLKNKESWLMIRFIYLLQSKTDKGSTMENSYHSAIENSDKLHYHCLIRTNLTSKSIYAMTYYVLGTETVITTSSITWLGK